MTDKQNKPWLANRREAPPLEAEAKQINLKLPDELWFAAKVKSAQNRISLSAAIRQALAKWVAGDE